jgi:hypothetical protein
MAVRVKDLGQSAAKWSRNASAASADYATQAAAAANEWQSATVAAQQNYTQAISAGGIGQRFARGVQRAGAAKYQSRVTELGASRYGQGVAAAEGDWQTAFQPFAQAIASLTLPQRRPRGDPGNLQRVSAVTQRLSAVRMAQLGTGG